MEISEEHVQEFIAAYRRAHGVTLSREEALDAAYRVLAFVELFSKQPGDPQTDQPNG